MKNDIIHYDMHVELTIESVYLFNCMLRVIFSRTFKF